MVKTIEKPIGMTPVAEPEVSVDLQTAPIADVVKKLGGGLIGFVKKQAEDTGNKSALRQRIRQHLAEVADMAKDAGEASSSVVAKAGEVAFELYQARVDSTLSAPEVSDILGDIFGVKGTGKFIGQVMRSGEKGAGKTPAGTGEEIRKRVVRAYSAWDYCENGLSPSTKYYDGFDQNELGGLVEGLSPDAEGTNLWAFYRQVGEMKRVLSDPIPFHLNADRVAAFATKIGENVKGIAVSINRDGELKASYAGLLQTLLVINDLIDA